MFDYGVGNGSACAVYEQAGSGCPFDRGSMLLMPVNGVDYRQSKIEGMLQGYQAASTIEQHGN